MRYFGERTAFTFCQHVPLYGIGKLCLTTSRTEGSSQTLLDPVPSEVLSPNW